MCRWLAYTGGPVLIEHALPSFIGAFYTPAHSLIDQSLHARLGAETTQRGRLRPRLV
jgi:glutamine amidotransferase